MSIKLYKHLPPLNALKAFEASARHVSFTLAAEELAVTQGAVSRQVQKLEDYLGTQLFRRTSGGLTVTEEGEALGRIISSAFESIDRSIETLVGGRSTLRFQVAPTYAIRWLMPRMSAFTDTHERLDVRVTITIHPLQFDMRSFDAGIVYGDGDWPGLASVKLSEELLAPVCAPSVQEGQHALRRPSDLRNHVLLHSSTDHRDWPLWLNFIGEHQIRASDGPTFETIDLSVRAAEAGYGIAIGDLSLIGEDIADGKLCVPFEPPLSSGRGLYFVCQKERQSAANISALRDWVVATSPLHTTHKDIEGSSG